MVRHNAIRDQVFDELHKAGVPAEREKAGLLPGRPQGDGVPSPAQARRPADIWLPGRGPRLPQALDFAVSSGLRDPQPGAGENDVASLFAEYEEHKRSYKETEAQCQRQGLSFTPFVVEAHAGGISPLARRALDTLSNDIAAATHSMPAAVSLKIAQRISCSLQRESARAIIRRQPCGGTAVAVPAGWDAVPADLRLGGAWQ